MGGIKKAIKSRRKVTTPSKKKTTMPKKGVYAKTAARIKKKNKK